MATPTVKWVGDKWPPEGCRIWLRLPQTRAEYNEWLSHHGRPDLTDEQWLLIQEERAARLKDD